MAYNKVLKSLPNTSKELVCFPATLIKTDGHWLVGTEWPYAKGTVTMFDEGFHCSCKKKPNQPCNHIKNVKLRLYGTFDEHYMEA